MVPYGKANENVIQYNIGSTGNGHKIHGSFGITNATEYGADYVISCNKGNSDKTDDKILCGTCHRFCRDTDQYNNGPDEEKKQERKRMETAMNNVTVFPIALAASSFLSAPTARLMVTVAPMASPTIMTVNICMTWLPFDTAVMASTWSNCPMIKKICHSVKCLKKIR